MLLLVVHLKPDTPGAKQPPISVGNDDATGVLSIAPPRPRPMALVRRYLAEPTVVKIDSDPVLPLPALRTLLARLVVVARRAGQEI